MDPCVSTKAPLANGSRLFAARLTRLSSPKLACSCLLVFARGRPAGAANVDTPLDVLVKKDVAAWQESDAPRRGPEATKLAPVEVGTRQIYPFEKSPWTPWLESASHRSW